MPSNAFIDPALLEASSPSPSSSSGGSPPPERQPSRKRPRSDVSAEERREARAHRNRIAAQNSRDRRKVQFASLTARVNELEEENRQLKDELSKYRSQQQPVPQIVPTVSTRSPPQSLSAEALTAARPPQFTDTSRERENEELRERVRSLEKSWEGVVRMLAAQGKNGALALPSPPASRDARRAHSPLRTGGDRWHSFTGVDSGPAAGGSESPSRATSADNITLLSISTNNNNTPAIKIEANPTGVEDWFMDLISSSPDQASFPGGGHNAAALPSPAQSAAAAETEQSVIPLPSGTPSTAAFDWECGAADAEMQKLLALLPAPDMARDELVGLGLDIGASTESWSWTGAEITV
ncbi:hypothetical protein EXIGLDRAFT_761831 [Exidia glandulosa HHB12029]|uniref:X-box-binding protein 1 n=1 Tax=Exidia glandulosa HHB12029 TaxID=1314781 RepID=A0A165N4Z7_EXIGL|nr:hypothetical protein EXIGLDRAFT_761831 [Exidia glandulosa HHB12029]